MHLVLLLLLQVLPAPRLRRASLIDLCDGIPSLCGLSGQPPSPKFTPICRAGQQMRQASNSAC